MMDRLEGLLVAAFEFADESFSFLLLSIRLLSAVFVVLHDIQAWSMGTGSG